MTELCAAMEREILLLFGEMAELLAHPASCYELFPRIAAALRLYWAAKSECLAPALSAPALLRASALRPEEARARERALAKLEATADGESPPRHPGWGRLFDELARAVEEEISATRGRLVPMLRAEFSSDELVRLGDRFRSALRAAGTEGRAPEAASRRKESA